MISPKWAVDEVVAFCEEALQHHEGEQQRGDEKGVPSVYADSAPFLRDEQSSFPLVVVRFISDTPTMMTMKIIAGAYANDRKSGWEEVLNMLRHLRLAMIKKGVIANRLSLVADSEEPKITLPEEQPTPNFVGEMVVNFAVAGEAKREINWEEIHFDNY